MNRNNKSILVIDSGIGGLSTLSSISKTIKANYIYFADNKFAPYGNKSSEFIKNRLVEVISSLQTKYKFSIVILACNTATTSAIKHLRAYFPKLMFVGTEPAYKVAIDNGYKKPAIIATKRTINHISNFLSNKFNLISSTNLASNIENVFVFDSKKHKYQLLKDIYKLKKDSLSNDCLVLGCTHYVFLKQKLLKLLKIPIIEGNQGVSKQVFRNYQQNQIKKSSYKIILSHKNQTSLQNYKKILRQILANQINLW